MFIPHAKTNSVIMSPNISLIFCIRSDSQISLLVHFALIVRFFNLVSNRTDEIHLFATFIQQCNTARKWQINAWRNDNFIVLVASLSKTDTIIICIHRRAMLEHKIWFFDYINLEFFSQQEKHFNFYINAAFFILFSIVFWIFLEY